MSVIESRIVVPKVEVKDNTPGYKSRPHAESFDTHHRKIAFLGGEGFGKTTAIIEFLLMQLSADAYDRIFWISPTFLKDCGKKDNFPVDKLEVITKYSEPELLRILNYMDGQIESWKSGEHYRKVWDKVMVKHKEPDMDEFMLLEMHDWGRPEKKLYPTFAVVVDDSVCNKEIYAQNMNKRFSQFFTDHRHYSATIILSVQIFRSGIPATIRSGIGSWVLFNCACDKTRKMIAEDLVDRIAPELFLHMWTEACKDMHDFLYVDNRVKDRTKVFRRNWDTYLRLADGVKLEKHKRVKRENEKVSLL